VQLGYGRAGWYSYDWIDNDGRPNADRIVPELQDLRAGDQVLMVPGMGPRVRELAPGRHLLAGDVEAGTWCLASRLVSRWRVGGRLTPATAFWILSATRARSSWSAGCSRASRPGPSGPRPARP
jgi:hypothetical protein